MGQYRRRANCKVVAFIVRDPKNRPYVKVLYDYGDGLHDPFELSASEAEQANSIYRHAVPALLGNDTDRSIVKFNPETGAIFSEKDRNLSGTPAYVTGSEPGEQAAFDTISALSIGCSSSNVMMPFYVSDGKNQIFVNDYFLKAQEGIIVTAEEHKSIPDFEVTVDKIKELISGSKKVPTEEMER